MNWDRPSHQVSLTSGGYWFCCFRRALLGFTSSQLTELRTTGRSGTFSRLCSALRLPRWCCCWWLLPVRGPVAMAAVDIPARAMHRKRRVFCDENKWKFLIAANTIVNYLLYCFLLFESYLILNRFQFPLRTTKKYNYDSYKNMVCIVWWNGEIVRARTFTDVGVSSSSTTDHSENLKRLR